MQFKTINLQDRPTMDFFSSDIAVALAWVCGVAGFIFALVERKENRTLKIQLQNIQSLVQTSNSSTATDESKNDVTQLGEKNVYTKQNSGGMNIKM
jgi:hypothetical protein